MKNKASLNILFATCCLLVTKPTLAGELPITNKGDFPIRVYFLDGEHKKWDQSPLEIKPKKTSVFYYEGKGKYNVVVRTTEPKDNKVHEQVLGWMNFRSLVDRSNTAVLVIKGVSENRVKTIPYKVNKMVATSRTRERTVYTRVQVNNKWYWRPQVITEKYTVMQPVWEMRTREIHYSVMKFFTSIQSENQPLYCSVTFKTKKPGAFIIYGGLGCKATRRGDNPTDFTQKLPVGIYKVWTERNGKITSAKQAYELYEEARTITIEEKPST